MAHSTYQSDWLSCCYFCITKCCTQNSFVGICTLWKLYLIKSIWPNFINRPMSQTLGVKSCCLRGAQKPPSWFLLCCHPIKRTFSYAILSKTPQTQSFSLYFLCSSLSILMTPSYSLWFYLWSLLVNCLIVSPLDLWLSFFNQILQ